MSAALSADALSLVERARAAQHAVDLYLAPGGTRLAADRIVEVLHHADVRTIGDRAAWNLLFAAGELSLRVDVYRAYDLFRAAVAFVARVATHVTVAGDPLAQAAEMTFDFFFARPSHPLLPLRTREVIAALTTLIASGRRVAVRASIHGLGHLVAAAIASDDAIAALDELLADSSLDAELERYATEARTGTLR